MPKELKLFWINFINVDMTGIMGVNKIKLICIYPWQVQVCILYYIYKIRKGVVKMQVQISVYINKKLAEKLEREKNKSQAVREGLELYFQQKKRGE